MLHQTHQVSPPRASSVRYVIGCMSGTSLDGLDAALVRIDGSGLTMRAGSLGLVSAPFPEALATILRQLAAGQAAPAASFLCAARQLGQLHAQLCVRLCDQALPAGARLDAVIAHGQTICHLPQGIASADGETTGPMSMQLLDPWPIADALRVPVVSDLRQADLIAGGGGAPLTPLADWILFRGETPRVIVNLGGICNATLLPAEGGDPAAIRGADLGPCNLVLDDAVGQLFPGSAFDADGQFAARGRVHPFAEAFFAAHPWPADRSLGRENFPASWTAALLATAPGALSPHDRLASIVDAVARAIATRLPGGVGAAVFLAGGGAHNVFLLQCLRRHAAGRTMATLDTLGVPLQAREAVGWAVLGSLSRDGVPVSLPAVTGARDPGVAGSAIDIRPAAWVRAEPGPSGPSSGTAGVEEAVSARSTSLETGCPSGLGSRAQAPGTPRAEVPGALAPHARIAPLRPEEPSAGRGGLLTERRLAASADLDAMATEAVLRVMNQQDARIPEILAEAIPAITHVVDAAAAGMARGGRLIYVGAGTSGRLGVLDASECPPTFCTDPGQVVGIIAGGDGALRVSSEGKEDEEGGAIPELERLRLGPNDTLVGIAASGATPYVWGALAYAAGQGAATAVLSCVPLEQVRRLGRCTEAARYAIELPVGPEVVTGSTRLKAGTATKLALNMISTATMVRLGKVWGHLMVDVRASNAKLRDRALRILQGQTDLNHAAADPLLEAAGGRVKVALVMAKKNVGRAEAEALLQTRGGQLRSLLGNPV